jgi:large subunit ribosomal protein L16
MLVPKKTKYKRYHRPSLKLSCPLPKPDAIRRLQIHERNYPHLRVIFGTYGLGAQQPGWITARQLEATRRVLTRYVRRTGKIWIRVFPDISITERAAESRMGSGKGTVSYWVVAVTAGTVLFEISGLRQSLAHKVLRLASHKLPIKTRVVEKY